MPEAAPGDLEPSAQFSAKSLDKAILEEYLEGALPDAADRTPETNDGEPDDA
jgi:hypothetical protein